MESYYLFHYLFSVLFSIMIFSIFALSASIGWSEGLVFNAAILSTVSIPSTTLPKTVYWLSKNCESLVTIKNWDPALLGSAGGRGGGSGSRKINQIIGFRIEDKNVKKIYETNEKDLIELFEIPYSAVAMDITLSDGKQIVVQGVIDPDMITNYNNIISS